MYINEIFVAGYGREDIDYPPPSTYFTGYINNFNFGGYDIFQSGDSKNETGIFHVEPYIPPLVFNSVTFPNNDAHVQLSPLGSASGLKIHFLFRTNDPNGVILFSEGRNKELFAVELKDGRINMKVNY